MIMKVFIRNRDTGLYFVGVNRWTSDVAEAYNFHQSLWAMDFATRNDLTHTDLVYDFGADRESLVMPILYGLPAHQPRQYV